NTTAMPYTGCQAKYFPAASRQLRAFSVQYLKSPSSMSLEMVCSISLSSYPSGFGSVRGGMGLVGLKDILLVSSSRVFENGDACRRIFTSPLLISATSPGFIIAVASVASRVFRSSRKSSREIGKRKRFIHSWSPKNLNPADPGTVNLGRTVRTFCKFWRWVSYGNDLSRLSKNSKF